MIKEIVVLGIIFGLLGFGIYAGITNYLIGLDYQKDIGGYYDYADRSSDAKTKSEYFNKYIDALQEHNLHTGVNSIFWSDLPKASLDDNFKVALSIQDRLNKLATADPNSIGYGTAMEQLTKQEFCWFPEEAFIQKYSWNHGAWWTALAPSTPYNHCIVPIQ